MAGSWLFYEVKIKYFDTVVSIYTFGNASVVGSFMKDFSPYYFLIGSNFKTNYGGDIIHTPLSIFTVIYREIRL